MSLSAPLLGTSTPQTADMVMTESSAIPVLAYFHARSGPQLSEVADIPTDITVPQDIAIRMFPPTWRPGAIFFFELNGIFAICCGSTSRRVAHERGFTNFTIALVSRTLAFSPRQVEFLSWAAQTIADQDAINLTHALERYSAELSHPLLVHLPLTALLRKDSFSTLFQSQPRQILTLWRARIAGVRITVACSTDIEVACSLSYFISAMAIPVVSLDGCAFHLDMGDADRVRGGHYSVCAVTHRGLQMEDLSPVMLLPGSVVRLSNDVRWLARGGGSILRELSEAKGDEAMLGVLSDLSQRLNRICEARLVERNDLERIGLDRKNARAVALFAAEHGLPVTVAVEGGLFGCCGC